MDIVHCLYNLLGAAPLDYTFSFFLNTDRFWGETLFWAVFGMILGSILGSFANMLAYRLPRRVPLWGKRRSFCPHCGTVLTWKNLLPLVSFFVQRGHCATCEKPIPKRYFLTELVTTALGLVFFYFLKPSFAFFFLFLFVALWVLLLTDIETFELPDEITLGLLLAGWMAAVAGKAPFVFTFQSMFGSLVITGVLFLFGEFFYLLTRKDGLGLGDVKLLAAVAAFVGAVNTFKILGAAAVVQLVFFLVYRFCPSVKGLFFVNRPSDVDEAALPFGPAIIISFMGLILLSLAKAAGLSLF